jgi:poly-gamma-glutamate capsule biosynthesis protein CapA/YwtB (metallophosphatase superfamily)
VRRESPAVYRRRRLAALAALAAIVLLTVLLVRGCGGEDSATRLTAEAVRRAQLEAEPVELTISVSGDLLIHSPVFARALELGGGERYDFTPMLAELRPYVEEPDLAFCHVETPMGAGTPTGYPLFNSPPELAEAIAATGWDACSTAANHSIDQGQEGVKATLEALDRAGVDHTGSYDSARAQRRPLILEAEGVRVALLAYTTDTNGLPLPHPYSVNVAEDPGQVIADARRARERGADAVIVNMHWSSEITPEYVTEPSPEQERFARGLAEAKEITAVVGQGPHIVQPIERLGGEYVVFSEGNLISNQGAAVGLAAGSQDGLIALLELVVDGDGARVEGVRYVPVWVSQPAYTVLPVGDALESGAADAASLEASYERTTDVVGRGQGVEPVPERLP